jgi:NAD(P)-dependent dehydrogenase (short-subunit alcohol dehydrogenase family)
VAAVTGAASAADAPVVLVTGATGGIGGATTRRFLSGGWNVGAVDITEPAPLASQPNGSAIHHVTADLRLVADCQRAVHDTVAHFGRLDAVVNAAGVWTEGPSEDTTEAEWDRVLGVNLKGLYFVCAAAIPHLRHRGGSIINLSSDAGIQGNAGAAVYCASKGGVSLLSKALAIELAPDGVRVNAVCPGDVWSPMLRGQADAATNPQEYLADLLAKYPQGGSARFITPAEVAELIWYLAQPHAAPITGANISIDFGLSSGIR